MQPVTQAKLAGNAYRTLGLSASASQAAIETAARRMRIWPDAANIPPTPWDLIPWMGAVARSRRDIEQAVAVLTEPRTRVEERLLWYQAAQAPSADALDNKPTAPIDIAAHPAGAHDMALAALHRAYRRDAAVNDPGNWSRLMKGWGALTKSPDFVAWLGKIEAEGDFEKRASDDEIKAAVATLVPALIIALIPSVEAALARGAADPAALGGLLRMAGSSESTAHPIENLLDNLEDALNRHCDEMDNELRPRLLTHRDAPQQDYARNSEASYKAAAYYTGTISPALKNFCDLAEGNENRIIRAKSKCAPVLALLALGWEWSGQFITAEQTLDMALELARGTPAEPAILKDLDRCRPLAEAQRQGRTLPPTPQAKNNGSAPGSALKAQFRAASRSKKNRVGAGIIVGIIAAALRVALFSGNEPANPNHFRSTESITEEGLRALQQSADRDKTFLAARPSSDGINSQQAIQDADPGASPAITSWADMLSKSAAATRPADTFGETNRER